ncbi:MAG: D-glycero-beta-D-manno-heptose 1-phosphate adenylyltransferase, partial [Desulfobacteraceae bacterium]|nr:D-glycero-beta-D-manno-heptose 1-phosphate adenylyltransferase [Desulfobacteraceae bacterium]
AGEGPVSRLITLDPGQLAQARGSFSPLARRPYPFPDEDKLMELPALRARLARQQALGRRVVFTNGCFDIIHQGHVSYLAAARRLGDCLVVGLNSDQSIRALKGPQRPVNPESSRARVLAALGCVDFVVIFGEETPLELIRSLKPDLLVKGADWPLDRIVGAPEVLARGGQVAAIPMAPGFSTTGMIQRIRGQD